MGKKGVLFIICLLLLLPTAVAEEYGFTFLERIRSFLNLEDTPASYVGEGGECVAVNGAENGLEFISCGGGGGASNPFDQDLNKSDNVNFGNVTTQGNLSVGTNLSLESILNCAGALQTDANGNVFCGAGGGGGGFTNVTFITENFLGVNLTGLDGETSRQLNASTLSSANGTQLIFLDSYLLRETDDYTVSSNTIVFVVRTFDTQRISIRYIISDGVILIVENFVGSDASGADGNSNRVITTSGVNGANGEIIVFLDSQVLRITDDYTISGNDITISLRVFDTQRITVSYI